jgi:hypothetical protein
MGNLEKEYTKDESGTYTLAGVTALYHHIPFIEVIDRAYGNYDNLKVNSMSEAALANYRKVLEKINSPEIYREFAESGFATFVRDENSTIEGTMKMLEEHFQLNCPSDR